VVSDNTNVSVAYTSPNIIITMPSSLQYIKTFTIMYASGNDVFDTWLVTNKFSVYTQAGGGITVTKTSSSLTYSLSSTWSSFSGTTRYSGSLVPTGSRAVGNYVLAKIFISF
jgi:hypothetical protein